MRQTFYILTISVLMTSCATIGNQPYTNIKVYTTEPSEIVYEQNTAKTKNNKAKLRVERKNETLSIVAITDSLTKFVEIEPINSFFYWCNIVCNFGIGMLVEKDHPHRYSYPQRIYLNSADTISKFYRYSQSNKKGELHLHLSLPSINSFRMVPESEGTKINTGFNGLAIGLDYYHSNNQFVSFFGAGVQDFFMPPLGAIDMSGEWELMNSLYISLSNNHRVKRFTFGYGLSYGRNTWDFIYTDRFDPPPPTREPVKKSHNAIGLIFPTYFQMREHFFIGVVYRPTFIRPDMPDKFVYEHLISIDFAWKIRIKK